MSTPPDILKYFHEEPVLLEPVTPNSNPDARRRNDRSEEVPYARLAASEDPFDTQEAHRGYLAGTNRAEEKIGVTSLRFPSTYTAPLLDAFGRAWWGHYTTEDTLNAIDPEEAAAVLAAPADTAVLVTGDEPIAAERIAAVAGRSRRHALSALRTLLETAHVVFFPEPAHDGSDWSFFSTAPMRDRLVSALRSHPTDEVRRFVLPYKHARSESKFYFDQWQLTASPLPEYIEEV